MIINDCGNAIDGVASPRFVEHGVCVCVYCIGFLQENAAAHVF